MLMANVGFSLLESRFTAPVRSAVWRCIGNRVMAYALNIALSYGFISYN